MPGSPPKAAVVFIFITVLFDVVALGIIIPVLPRLVEQFMAGDTAHAAQIYGGFGTAWALMQFVFSPVLGALSDRFGRRPVILLSCFGLGLDYLLMALAPNLAWLFVGRVISGITAASFSTASAYIADVTPPERRAASYGLIGAAWGVGFVLGPALGGLLGHVEPRLPFWVAGLLALANAAYGYFVLPESLPRDKRAALDWRRANPLGSLRLLRSHPELAGLASVNALFQLAHYVFPSVFVLYSGYRFGWNAQTTGLTLALVGICNVTVQAGLVRPTVARFGERRMLVASLGFAVVGMVWYGLAPTGGWFWLAVPVFAVSGFFGPSLQGLMTHRVGPHEQGRLQGANASIMALAGLVAPLLFTQTFAAFIGPWQRWHQPGAPFLLAAVLLFAALLIAARVSRQSATA